MIDLTEPLSELVTKLHNSAEWIEGHQLEFKEGANSFPKDAWSTCSAFANTEGGLLIIGVKDNGDLSGLINPQKIKKEFIDTINNKEKISYLPVREEDVLIESINNVKILAIRIVNIANEFKPVYLNNNESKCFTRKGSADQLCSEQLRHQMIRDRTRSTQDLGIVPDSNLSDLDSITITQYRSLMLTVNPNHPWHLQDNEEFLKKILAYKVDRATGNSGVTLAGLLMFGTDDALRSLRPHYKVEYYEMIDDPSIEQRWKDRIYIDGTWTPNLFQFFHRVKSKLELDLKRPFKLNDNNYRSDESKAHIAVREALANAIIHADYASSEGIRIEKSSKSIVLRNAGTLLLPRDIIFQGGHSQCRNVTLQTMFNLIGISEKAGSGIDKMVNGWLDEYIAAPELQEQIEPANVKWILPYIGLIERKDLNHIREIVGEAEFDAMDLWKKIILILIRPDDWISHNDISKVLHIHSAEISQRLSKLVQDGHIITQGRSRGTTYQLHPKFQRQDVDDDLDRSKVSTSAHVSDLYNSLNEDLKYRIDEYGKKKRQNRDLTHCLIIDILEGRWVSLMELSKLLNRKSLGIYKDFIEPAIRNGVVRRLHPEPHPKQEFRSNKNTNMGIT